MKCCFGIGVMEYAGFNSVSDIYIHPAYIDEFVVFDETDDEKVVW
jgi:hypothetical protein